MPVTKICLLHANIEGDDVDVHGGGNDADAYGDDDFHGGNNDNYDDDGDGDYYDIKMIMIVVMMISVIID